MNRSGDVIAEQAHFFDVAVDEIVVIHDDLDLSFGTIRIKEGGGLAGHNGLRSIADRLGARDFIRIRVGIGRPEHKGMVSSYVLNRFPPEEQEHLSGLLDGVVDATELLIQEGIGAAQRRTHPQDFFVS
jgi:PTH1 family peptidyl-tRNA hydrolase